VVVTAEKRGKKFFQLIVSYLTVTYRYINIVIEETLLRQFSSVKQVLLIEEYNEYSDNINFGIFREFSEISQKSRQFFSDKIKR